jgi:two-component system cell cycle response regulator CpdR
MIRAADGRSVEGRGAFATGKSLNVPNEDSNLLKCRRRLENFKAWAHREVTMIRILLAEDDTSMREYLQRALQRVGYEVEAVGCGTEAMPLLEAGKYDLLLTDIVMPEMDGIELAQKASSIDPAIRVMFITGFAAVALQGGRTAPEAKLLSKPFHLKDLVAEVDRLFQTEDQHGRL